MNYTDAPNRPKLVLSVTGALCRYPKWGGTCPTDHGLRFAKRSCRMVHITCTTHTTRCAARSCGVCEDARRDTTTPPPPTHIKLHVCHAMEWVGETISHLCRTSSRPFRVAAPDLGCDETIGVQHELCRHSKPHRACALCHGGALQMSEMGWHMPNRSWAKICETIMSHCAHHMHHTHHAVCRTVMWCVRRRKT